MPDTNLQPVASKTILNYSKIIAQNAKPQEHKQVQINRNKDRWQRSNNNIITTQANKQTNKKVNNRNTLCNKQTCICIILINGNEKSLIKFAAVSAKTLKIVKCF